MINAIVNADLPQLSIKEYVSWCSKLFQLLVLVSYFTMKSQLLWNKGEYFFPQMKSCFLKRNKCYFLTRFKLPKNGLRTSVLDWSDFEFEHYKKCLVLDWTQTMKHFSFAHQLLEAINIDWNIVNSSFYKKCYLQIYPQILNI